MAGKWFNILVLCGLSLMFGCGPARKSSDDPAMWTDARVSEWFESKNWLAETGMQPDPSINQRELAIQYQRHQHWWDTAFAYMKKGDYSDFVPGNTPLQGEDVFVKASAYDTKDPSGAFYEVHRNYADIHFVVSGEEYIGYADLANARPRAAYDTAKDIQFFEGAEGEQRVAKPGVFFIFFPGEAHRPGVRTSESAPVKKIVIKVRS